MLHIGRGISNFIKGHKNWKEFVALTFCVLTNFFKLMCLQVEVIYRKESLPDNYSLMDIAYIYTWKRVCTYPRWIPTYTIIVLTPFPSLPINESNAFCTI